MRQMQSITLIRSLTTGDKTPRMNQALADQNKSGPEHIDLVNSICAALDHYLIVWPAFLIQYVLLLVVHTGLEICLIYLSTIEF